jgi:hypothetical protein
MNFRSKIEVLELIMHKYHAEFLKTRPKLIDNMVTYAIEERNIFAHYLLSTTPDWLKKLKDTGDFGFEKFKVTKTRTDSTTLWYNQEKVNKILEELKQIRYTLTVLINDHYDIGEG